MEAMALYFFHLRNSSGYLLDEEGQEFPDLETVRAEAVRTVRSILSEELKAGQIDLRGRLEVTDAEGALLLTLPFSETVEVRTGPPVSEETQPGVDA
jgi:hypothetical protein